MSTYLLDSPTPETPAMNVVPAPASGRPRWELPSLAALLISTAVLYLWNLSASGNANDFYAAAVQAGTKSWKAFFYGSFDSSNFITVDKPPASLWPMELSGRIFGFNSWSMLAPQALMGVAAVGLLYASVRRWFGPGAALLAGGLFATTPVAALMFRFNNPDALMTLLVVAAAYCTIRAIEKASTKWLLITGVIMGFSFLAKGLQPFTVLPALAVAYLVAAPTGLGRRIWQLLASGVAILVGAGWWVLAVQLTPAGDRPYIGGSTNNSVLDLAFGYNGLSRLTGSQQGGSFSGTAGIGRLFNALNGSQIAWLLPAALVALVALLTLAGSAVRTDRLRAAAIIFGGWLLVTGGLLSYAGGVIHTYYTVELAPAIGALVGIGAAALWHRRADVNARLAMALAVAVTGGWTYVLLSRASGWNAWLNDVVLIATVVAVIALLVPAARFARAGVIALIAGVLALAAGPAAYAVSTANTPQTGSIPSAGPTASGSTGGPGGGFGGGQARGGQAGGGPAGRGQGGPAGGTANGASGIGISGEAPSGTAPTGQSGTRPTGSGGAGGQSANSALTALLKASTTKWAAATVGSQSAAPYELASGKAIMAIGGFTGSDPSITLAQFEKLVESGQIHYFIGGGNSGGGPGGGSSSNSEITSWVSSHFTATTVGGTTVYDLTKATS
jgi:4-amino-4-deoxy-L-arabinose transferase-like glycosyltransferase